MSPPATESPIPRPGWGCFFFSAPLAFALLITLAYVVLFGVGMQGFTARGERVAMVFETCDEARRVLDERVAFMGLGDPVWSRGQPVLTATLPAQPSAEHIPTTLARPGVFSIRRGDRADGEILFDGEDVVSAEFSLKEMGNPLVLLKLASPAQRALEAHMEAHLDERIGLWIDDEPMLVRPNDPPFRRAEIDVRTEGDDGVDNIRRAVDWGMLITHGPLPCPTRLVSAKPVTGS